MSARAPAHFVRGGDPLKPRLPVPVDAASARHGRLLPIVELGQGAAGIGA
jgi:hypothetical protein